MNVQDLWDIYEEGLDPSYILQFYGNIIDSDPDLIDAMVEILLDFDVRVASGEFEEQ